MKKIIIAGLTAIVFSCAMGFANAYEYNSAKKSASCACNECSCTICTCTDCSAGNCDSGCCDNGCCESDSSCGSGCCSK